MLGTIHHSVEGAVAVTELAITERSKQFVSAWHLAFCTRKNVESVVPSLAVTTGKYDGE